MAKNKEQETALATVGHNSYALSELGGLENLATLLKENIGDEGMDVTDMERLGIPTGGGTQWEVPSLDGEPQMQSSVEGVIICWKNIRLYWGQDIDAGGAGSPPDCISQDAIVGVGEPGGHCAHCPKAKFGSAHGGQGRGQACKTIRQLFLLQENATLPICVNLPPSSLKPIRQYFLRLSMNHKLYYSVVTKLELERTKNQDNVSYSVVKPSVAAILDPNAVEFFSNVHEAFAPLLERVVIDGTEYQEASTDDGQAD